MSFVVWFQILDALMFANTGHREKTKQKQYREDLKQHFTLNDDKKVGINKLLKLISWPMNYLL